MQKKFGRGWRTKYVRTRMADKVRPNADEEKFWPQRNANIKMWMKMYAEDLGYFWASEALSE